jgi:hypothetical protein
MKKPNSSPERIDDNGRSKYEQENLLLLAGIQELTEQSGTFQFFIDDEDLYSVHDIKEKYT